MYSDEWIKKQNIECGKAVRLNTISNYYIENLQKARCKK